MLLLICLSLSPPISNFFILLITLSFPLTCISLTILLWCFTMTLVGEPTLES